MSLSRRSLLAAAVGACFPVPAPTAPVLPAAPVWMGVDLALQRDKCAVLVLLTDELIERKHHKDIAELIGVCRRLMWIGEYHVPAASLPYTLTSDAGNLMAQGYPFAACYWDTEEDRVFSLRSTPTGLDVSEIAKLYGGGGHVHAAGFKVPRDHPLARA